MARITVCPPGTTISPPSSTESSAKSDSNMAKGVMRIFRMLQLNRRRPRKLHDSVERTRELVPEGQPEISPGVYPGIHQRSDCTAEAVQPTTFSPSRNRELRCVIAWPAVRGPARPLAV